MAQTVIGRVVEMTRQVCSYCNQSAFSDIGRCLGCGASVPIEVEVKVRDIRKGEPFTYNGVVFWPIYDMDMHVCNYHVYTGNTLQAVIPISRELLEEMFPNREVGSGYSINEFLWELFLVAIGEKKQILWEDISKNKEVKPAYFKFIAIQKYEDPEEHLFGLSLRELREMRDRVYSR